MNVFSTFQIRLSNMNFRVKRIYKYTLENMTKYNYSKTCLKRTFKKDKTKILMTNGSLMQVKSIAECSIKRYLAVKLNFGSF